MFRTKYNFRFKQAQMFNNVLVMTKLTAKKL